MKIPLSLPEINNNDRQAVLNVLKTPQLSLGPKLIEFEKIFAKYIDVKYAIAVNSGTSGLHLCIKAYEIKDGDEVITTPFSFIASANCILFERAKPVFVDIREDTLNIDEGKIEKAITKKTKAILIVHVFGYPANMKKIMEIAKKYKLVVIEDACEAIGATVNKKKVGGIGDCGVFAFYPNKQMTTGEGGMIVTNNLKTADLIRSLRNQGRGSMEWLSHERLGYNYRLSDINCALGISQLKRINSILKKREKVASKYSKLLSKIKGIIIPPVNTQEIKRSWFVFVLRLSDNYDKLTRDQLMKYLNNCGISSKEYFPPIHLEPFYQKMGFYKGQFPITEKISQRTLAIPFYNNLKEKQIRFIVNKVQEKIEKMK